MFKTALTNVGRVLENHPYVVVVASVLVTAAASVVIVRSEKDIANFLENAQDA